MGRRVEDRQSTDIYVQCNRRPALPIGRHEVNSIIHNGIDSHRSAICDHDTICPDSISLSQMA